ncbi:MAG: PKD domain-containing protein, partial [Saprospiraceae bacterium]
LTWSDLAAEGTQQLASGPDELTMLLAGDSNFGNFAAYDGPESSRLYISIAEAGETVYLGLSREFNFNGTPENFGSYNFRIRSAADGSVVHGPYMVSAANENLTQYGDLLNGPGFIGNPLGYDVSSEEYHFSAPAAGTYYIEFTDVRFIGLWDITIVNNGTVKPGRIYSKNWAFRVPETNPVLPDCVWGAEFKGKFYSYTSDGFVTEIDFASSGFQPLSFNLAFNTTGPGTTGNAQLDRMSVENQNLTNSSAEHFIFLAEPDIALFPDGECGEITTASFFRCSDEEAYCLPVTVTRPGQTEIILDFNGNQRYDEGIDQLVVHTFTENDLEACLPWNGLLGNGNLPAPDQQLDLVVTYTQGVQHWALFDGEKMTSGFCINTIRPLCNGQTANLLHWDDRNISMESGTGQPKDGREGCDCSEDNCRTWNNFDAATQNCNAINDGATSGYGDKNTLNTWWYASSKGEVRVNMPTVLASINASLPTSCEGKEIILTLESTSNSAITQIEWVGPDGTVLPTGITDTEITVTQPGTYTINVTETNGCSFSESYTVAPVVCTQTALVAAIECDDNGTDTDPADDFFMAVIELPTGPGAGWVISGDADRTGTYGQSVTVGPFAIADGDRTITVTDADFPCCEQTFLLAAPPTCSGACALQSIQIGEVTCLNMGTLQDPDDDRFTFTITITGQGLSDHWTADDGSTGPYGVPVQFGPYDADGPLLVRTFRDSELPACSASATIDPPGSCSDECYFEPVVSNILCQDNNTPHDPTDDLFTFDITAASVNGTSAGWLLPGYGLETYGTAPVTFGPYPISGGDLDLVMQDLGNAGCTQPVQVEVPAACSDACGISVELLEVTCREGNDVQEEGGKFSYSFIVSNLDPTATQWMGSDGSTGFYGTVFVSADHPYTAQSFNVQISDADQTECTASLLVEPTLPSVTDCPDNVASIDRTAAYRLLDGNTENGTPLSQQLSDCWLPSNEPAAARPFTRIDIGVAAEATQARVYHFYLAADQPVCATLLRRGADETLRCENRQIGSPVQTGELLTAQPLLMGSDEELYPSAEAVVYQHFSVLLSPGQAYALLTTSALADVNAGYRWIIAGAALSDLTVTAPEHGVSDLDDRLLRFELSTSEIPFILNIPPTDEIFGLPTVEDDCGLIDITFGDLLTTTCDSAHIERNFSLILADTTLDTECLQRIGLVDQLDRAVLAGPPTHFYFGCQDVFPALTNGHPDPDYTGYPSLHINGATELLAVGQQNNLTVSYSDQNDGNTDSTVIRRTWLVSDSCTIDTFRQVFVRQAGGSVELVCPISNHYCPIVEEDIMLFTTAEFGCEADVLVPEPELLGICDSSSWVLTTEILALNPLTGDTVLVNTLTADDDRLLAGFPAGEYFFRYIAVDTILDITLVRLCRFRVADVTEPVMICKSFINLSLPGGGVHRVRWQQVDQGSYDNCETDLERSLRRRISRDPADCSPLDTVLYSEWGPFVDFNCCDVGDTIEVELRIVDGAGNTNYCTSLVSVVDQVLPVCTGLSDVTIACTELPDNFSATNTNLLAQLFGFPSVVDNCPATATELTPLLNGDGCTADRIVRRFLARDIHGNVAAQIYTQTINLIRTHDYAFYLPADLATDCVNDLDSVRVTGSGCDSITLDFIEVSLPVIGADCRRVG